MGQLNYPSNKSAKEYSDSILKSQSEGFTVQEERTSISTKKSIGYVEGYAQYLAKYGGLITTDGTSFREEEITTEGATESEKPTPLSKQINKQTNQFRNIFGYNNSERKSDSLEDPTFLIFDLHMDFGESPLFNSVNNFFNEYSSSMEELQERKPLYDEFIAMISKIFPGDLNEQSGSKRHYINSIGGMDNLFKKIVTYPDDVLTFTLSEDITMLSQYLSELYSNLVYSYDSQRYMIPDNLLRFNLTIFFRDVREMKSVKYNETGEYIKDEISDSMSKFAYVLHDCQFDFFNSRSFGSDMTVSGFEGGATTTPSSLSFNINYKSYSKITMPSLIDNSILIDLRERDGADDGNYNRFNNDYQSQFEHQDTLNKFNDDENLRQGGLISDNINAITDNQGKKKSPISDYANRLKNSFTDEISDIRNVLVNKIKEEVTVLSSQAQRFVSDEIFGGINIPGFQNITLTKINVYYDDPFQAINRVSFLLENFLDKTVDEAKGRVNIERGEDGRLNIYYDKQGETFGEEVKSIIESAYSTGEVPRTSNVYDESGLKNGKTPTGDNVYGDSKLIIKDELGGDRHEDGTYNEKIPEGDVHEDGQYNEKIPEGDVHPEGVYNEKYPHGDVHPDGQYNEKVPLGSVQDKGTYNEKYPEGDVHPDGQYNDKPPKGDVHEDGQYNEKIPEGDVHEDGQYNENEPKGDVYSDDELVKGVIKPSGNVYGKKEEKEAELPEGDVHPDGQYNEKYPKGNLYKKNNDK